MNLPWDDAFYIQQIGRFKDSLYAKTLRSQKAKAVIKNIIIPEIKEGYFIVEGKDVPGLNKVKIIMKY